MNKREIMEILKGFKNGEYGFEEAYSRMFYPELHKEPSDKHPEEMTGDAISMKKYKESYDEVFKKPTMRDEIHEFALAMEKKMKAKDSSKGDSWKGMGLIELEYLLDKEYEELKEGVDDIDPEELVDIANFCMMMHHHITQDTEPIVRLTIDEVKDLLMKDKYQCTYEIGGVHLNATWSRDSLIEEMEKSDDIQRTGKNARRLGYKIAFIEPETKDWLFVRTGV